MKPFLREDFGRILQVEINRVLSSVLRPLGHRVRHNEYAGYESARACPSNLIKIIRYSDILSL